MKKIALVLAGGKGARLWPLSRENYPKQFVELDGGFSLFQLTLRRLIGYFGPENIYIVVPEDYRFTVRNQIDLFSGLALKSRKKLQENMILEPAPRGTLGAVLFSLKALESSSLLDSGDTVYVFPSDHRIEPLAALHKDLDQAAKISRSGRIAMFGVRPLSPKTEYGYAVAGGQAAGGLRVMRFIEKPSLGIAKKLLRARAFWNCGIFCFTPQIFLNELDVFWPGIYRFYYLPQGEFKAQFAQIPSLSVDRAIMQKTKKAVLVRAHFSWSDLVTWDHYLESFASGPGNFKIGQAKFIDSKNCFSYSRNRLVCTVGLKDVMAIDSADSLLLVRRGASHKVKELVQTLERDGFTHNKDGLTVYRPWGYYTILHEAQGYKVKEIGIYPRKSLSLQKHKYRSEHWNVVEGQIKVSVDGSQKSAKKNESVFVPRAAKHRIYNPTKKIAKLIEVQIGPYLGEDDIKRYTTYE